ncbi:hypothetical protein ABTP01_19835, partial [Acinetobacter baumannii]
VEPELPLDLQATLWSAGFAALALGIAACGTIMLSRKRADAPDPITEATATIGPRDRLIWMALAFIPSSLLLGVTQHIATDI